MKTATLTPQAGSIPTIQKWSFRQRRRKGRLKIDGRLSGVSATNYSFTMPEVPAEDEAHQVSRWLPFVKAALLTSYDEVKADNTAMTIEAHEIEDGKDTLVLSGTMQIAGYRMADAVDGRIGEYTIDSMSQSMQTLDTTSGQMLNQTTSQGKTVYTDMDAARVLRSVRPRCSPKPAMKWSARLGFGVDTVQTGHRRRAGD